MEILLIIGKTILFYFLLIFILRLMGKREVGELSIFDIVVFFLISELFSLAIDSETKLTHVLIPIALIVLLQFITSFLALKFDKIRFLIDGKPSILIKNGIIQQKELKKHRYSIDDLFLQIRGHDIDSIDDIEYAILETNGSLSVIRKSDAKTYFPFPIIQDGKLNNDYLKILNISEEWIIKELKDRNITSINMIFLLFIYKDDLFIIFKEPND